MLPAPGFRGFGRYYLDITPVVFSIPDKQGFFQHCLRLLPWIHGVGCVCFAVHPSTYEASTSVASSFWHDERLPADFRLQQKAVFRGILDPQWQCAVDHEPAAPACALLLPKGRWQLRRDVTTMQPQHP